MIDEMSNSLSDLSVLIVEDETAIAMSIEELVTRLGCCEVHCAARLSDALQVISSTTPSLAVLDVNLAGEMAFPIAERLSDLGVPSLLITGYDSSAIPKKWLPHVVRKPYDPAELAFLLSKMAQRIRAERPAAA
jgi:DNA-binding response OmpR family regulator